MFFGLEVKSNQAKPITLENTVKLSNAVLEPTKNGKKEPVSLIAEYNKKQFVLCVLDPSLSWQCPLDLFFEGGTEVKFSLRGSGTVHLTGYEPVEDDDDDYSISDISSSDNEDEQEVMDISPSKVKRLALTNGTGSAQKSAKKAKQSQESDDGSVDYSDSDDEDFELIKQSLGSSSDDEDISDEDEELTDSDEDEEDDDDDDDDESSECQIEEMVEDSD